MEIVVRVPSDTPYGARLFLAGSGPLGDWHPAAVPLTACDDGSHRAWLDVPSHFRAHFLVTQGRWRAAETDPRGHEHPPRELHAAPHVEVHVGGWGRTSVRYHPDFHSRFVPRSRTVCVWLPPGYDAHPHRRYPVLYMHDGQNLFDPHTAFAGNPWWADEHTECAVRAGRTPPVILVGIANTEDRLHEYGPRRCGPAQTHDLSRAYGRFVVEEVKPFIDTEYRTRPERVHTGVGGSSMGGLISLHLAKWYPGVFGKCMAMSASLWWDREFFLRTLDTSTLWQKSCAVWADAGDREGRTPAGCAATARRVRWLAQLLRKRGARVGHLEVPGGTHSEGAWGERLPRALAWLYERDVPVW